MKQRVVLDGNKLFLIQLYLILLYTGKKASVRCVIIEL